MAAQEVGSYRQFFDVDKKYFPCIDDSAISAGAPWENTYPHKTFIELLQNVEAMLGGRTNRSVWIHGAYGTGKSQCAYALKKMLDVPEEELREYWNTYDDLKENQDLLNKMLGHKDRGIITAYRYASGGITTPQELYFSIQEAIQKSLIENNISYKGEKSLKQNVISWIESNNEIFDLYLKKPKWEATFSQSNAEEVLNVLKKSGDVKKVMDNIFKLASEEGIRAMTIDGDMLKDWIKDIIDNNNIKIVFIWDEFSGYFKQNRNSLDEFQKIIALCEEKPFYFVPVTHQTESIINDGDNSWKVIQQRFNFSEIKLPDNIAFNLIGHAFNVKPAAAEMWNICADDLNSRLSASRSAVMKVAKISDPKVIKDIMPIHPMTALVLKNIAQAFQSNQRSMFDFIKLSEDENTKAFQWFIENYGPGDDHPLLTIDMLWDFFYEKGRDNLTPDIRMILDTYSQYGTLREDEQIVLKTILIMQALDKRLGGAIDLFKPTEQNISYAFEGISSGLDVSCKGIAKALAAQGILVSVSIDANKYAYGVAVLAGDQSKIEEYKKAVRKSSTTAKLVAEGKLATALSLSPALRLRYEATPNEGDLIPVTITDFTRIINSLKDKASAWHFNAVLALAKDDEEVIALRKLIKEAANNPDYNNIIFIDALSTPLGEEDFSAYVEFSALSQYYQGNNNQSSKENALKATQILSLNWKNRIYTGTFDIYYEKCPDGEKVVGGQGVANVLQAIVIEKHKYIFDFNRGVTENQLKLTQTKVSASCGIEGKTRSVVSNAEKSVLPEVWNKDNYWNNPTTSSLNISYIKRAIEEKISQEFDKEGQVSIGELYNFLEGEFGFAPTNLTAFLLGFLLKEYSGDTYRYTDSTGSHETMTPDKLAEMIGNYIGKKPQDTFIVKMTPEEKSFYAVTEEAWGIAENSCSSVGQASLAVKNKMQSLGLPIWCLEKVDDEDVFCFVDNYIEMIQKEGKEARKIAIEIGKCSQTKPAIGKKLNKLITAENCQKGMKKFLESFEGGKVLRLAEEINASDCVIQDITRLFSVAYSSLWEKETGLDEIKKIITDYSFVKVTNEVIKADAKSKSEAFDKWVEKLSFMICSHEALQSKFVDLKDIIHFLLSIFQRKEILPEQMKNRTQEMIDKKAELVNMFEDELEIFAEIYRPYLEGLSTDEIRQIPKTELINVFRKTQTESNAIVKDIVNEFKKNQTKTKMFKVWKDKTGSKNPIEWSYLHKTPILLVLDNNEYDDAKKAFDVLNRASSTEREYTNTLEYLEQADFYSKLSDQNEIQLAFEKLLGKYKCILTDYEMVRDVLSNMSIEVYEWNNHPAIKEKIKQLADNEYNAGGSDLVVSKINSMNSEDLKKHLVKMIKSNINLGIEIMNGDD